MRSIARYCASASSLVILCPLPPRRRRRRGPAEGRRSRAKPHFYCGLACVNGAAAAAERAPQSTSTAIAASARPRTSMPTIDRANVASSAPLPAPGGRPAVALERRLHLGPGHVEEHRGRGEREGAGQEPDRRGRDLEVAGPGGEGAQARAPSRPRARPARRSPGRRAPRPRRHRPAGAPRGGTRRRTAGTKSAQRPARTLTVAGRARARRRRRTRRGSAAARARAPAGRRVARARIGDRAQREVRVGRPGRPGRRAQVEVVRARRPPSRRPRRAASACTSPSRRVSPGRRPAFSTRRPLT